MAETPDTLAEWLDWAERQHPAAMEFTLDRVARAARTLGLMPRVPVVTIAGTNGKGSTAHVVEALLRGAGHHTGRFTSPHLIRFNERIALAGRSVPDRSIQDAFERVARDQQESLTYFELSLLVALECFLRADVGVIVLEVGLGGRLDATNIVDADVAVVTSIALDHEAWLGNDIDVIGAEKAAIGRPGRPFVLADPAAPASVLATAGRIGCDPILVAGRDFQRLGATDRVRLIAAAAPREVAAGTPLAPLEDGNVLAGLQAACLIDPKVADLDCAAILATVRVPGRRQLVQLPGDVEVILDVAHNPHSAVALGNWLAAQPPRPTWAVLGMLDDKDAAAVVAALQAVVDHWVLVGVPGPRGLTAEALLARTGLPPDSCRADDPLAGWQQALAVAQPGTRIVVCGSFLTVGPVLAALGEAGA